jgi:hypothetical protein
MFLQAQGNQNSFSFFAAAQSLEWTFDPAATSIQCTVSTTGDVSHGGAITCTVTGILAPLS